eukprot:TRINITY_DN15795_c0_g1_i1.p1 TRINITY_DN15795_c0_g1~~TRINITY_DN15795_c0_g1_i1.p1  ORF type:complete len:576 (-),score=166.82 TRINITY_DN15795_c0_g1_i1:129-1856(-)
MLLVTLLIFSFSMVSSLSSTDWPCDHPVFCKPDKGLLHEIQLAKIFKDSKTFVDMPMKSNTEQVLAAFDKLSDYSKSTLVTFVKTNFDVEGTEMEEVLPSDWKKDPKFIENIEDENFKNLAVEMNEIWKNLTKKITKSQMEIEEKSSLIYLEHPFVVPGGRFREVYYWDSYWTIKGLLLSEMFNTTKGMIQNFQSLIKTYGHIPNGNRVYYTKRSQPPLFTQMVWDYLNVTNNPETSREFIAEVIWQLDDEFKFWMNRMVNVSMDSKMYKLARYRVEGDGPRPESYEEDHSLAMKLAEGEREEWYSHMKSGAESGWDYSSRWFATNQSAEDELLGVETGNIIPVDLNSFLCKNAEIMENLFLQVEKPEKAAEYRKIRDALKEAIRAVLFNTTDGMWYDYNIKTNLSNYQFYPSNLAPLYCSCYHKDINITTTMDYMIASPALNKSGGIPSSLLKTSQQWDLPNVWPPLVELTVTALENTHTAMGRSLAREVAGKYLKNVVKSFANTGAIFEKYNCEEEGKPGGGGEYDVQEGFGWTNGVTLSLLAKYPTLSSSSPLLSTLSLLVIGLSSCLYYLV